MTKISKIVSVLNIVCFTITYFLRKALPSVDTSDSGNCWSLEIEIEFSQVKKRQILLNLSTYSSSKLQLRAWRFSWRSKAVDEVTRSSTEQATTKRWRVFLLKSQSTITSWNKTASFLARQNSFSDRCILSVILNNDNKRYVYRVNGLFSPKLFPRLFPCSSIYKHWSAPVKYIPNNEHTARITLC